MIRQSQWTYYFSTHGTLLTLEAVVDEAIIIACAAGVDDNLTCSMFDLMVSLFDQLLMEMIDHLRASDGMVSLTHWLRPW